MMSTIIMIFAILTNQDVNNEKALLDFFVYYLLLFIII